MREELSSPGCRHCCLKRERKAGGGGGWGSKRTRWRASDGQCAEVGEDDIERSRPKKRGEKMCDGRGEVSTGCSSPHTPVPEGTAQSLCYVKGEEQVVP